MDLFQFKTHCSHILWPLPKHSEYVCVCRSSCKLFAICVTNKRKISPALFFVCVCAASGPQTVHRGIAWNLKCKQLVNAYACGIPSGEDNHAASRKWLIQSRLADWQLNRSRMVSNECEWTLDGYNFSFGVVLVRGSIQMVRRCDIRVNIHFSFSIETTALRIERQKKLCVCVLHLYRISLHCHPAAWWPHCIDLTYSVATHTAPKAQNKPRQWRTPFNSVAYSRSSVANVATKVQPDRIHSFLPVFQCGPVTLRRVRSFIRFRIGCVRCVWAQRTLLFACVCR